MAAVRVAEGVLAEPNYLEYKGKGRGLLSWLTSLDHKRIGLLYLFSQVTFFLFGMTLGFLIRLELIHHGQTIVRPEVYNAFFTVHGVTMVFMFVIPGAAASLGNFFLPIMIGAKDVAFPKLNLMSWYCYIIGAIIVYASMFTAAGLPDTGWTLYVPYSLKTTTNVNMAAFGIFVMGFSSILTGLNFICTIHQLRAPGMGWFKMPLFVWSLYATSWMQVLVTPILGITLVLLMLERVAGVGIFDPAKGGDPILYQHLFWIYSHPAVYIMIVPAMGVISEVIATHSRKTIFGYKMVALSSLAIALFGSLVWAHHMFVSGQSDAANLVFSLLTFLVAIPSAIKVFNWIATMYKGSVDLSPPMLFAMAFILLFAIGGFTGLMQGALSTDVHLHDTDFVVAHFHYVMFGGAGFGLFAGLHHWWPKMFGKMYNRRAATIACLLMFWGFNQLYFSMLILGWEGMPRRYWDYLPQYDTLNLIATTGSWVLITGLLTMFTNLLISVWRGRPAPENPWGGVTLEWTIASPPPLENFHVIPRITGGVYDFPEEVQP